MPGDQLLALNESTTSLESIDNALESYYDPTNKSLHSGNDLFVVLHELGHAKDFKDFGKNGVVAMLLGEDNLINTNSELNKIFTEEKEAFNKAFPTAQRENIDYFLHTLDRNGDSGGGLRETIAESNALSETPKSNELIAIRSQYLQQYFPRTIACLSHLL